MTRSVRIHEFGGPEVLRVEDVVVGEPGASEVRLRIHAVGLNRTELTLRSGRAPVKPLLPSAIGFEAAGVIEELGPNVSGFSVGDRVAVVPAYSGSARWSATTVGIRYRPAPGFRHTDGSQTDSHASTNDEG
jgi:NADPH:quinone reductase-like Zn-dependent oxidoreductase